MRLKRGFTLLELLIALFIFTLIAAIIATTLTSVFKTKESHEKKSLQLSQLQMAITLITREIEQVIDRPILKSNGTVAGAFIGGMSHVEFTHAGWFNPQNEVARSTLQRTAYYLEKNQLIRESWPVLDLTPHTPSVKRILLTDVQQFQLHYLNKENQFQSKWPPNEQSKADEEWPRAVRISLLLKKGEKIIQLIVIPGTKFDNKTT